MEGMFLLHHGPSTYHKNTIHGHIYADRTAASSSRVISKTHPQTWREEKWSELALRETLLGWYPRSTLKSKYLLPPLAVTGPYPRDGVELVSKQKINSPMNIHCQGIYHKPESVPQAKNTWFHMKIPLCVVFFRCTNAKIFACGAFFKKILGLYVWMRGRRREDNWSEHSSAPLQ